MNELILDLIFIAWCLLGIIFCIAYLITGQWKTHKLHHVDFPKIWVREKDNNKIK